MIQLPHIEDIFPEPFKPIIVMENQLNNFLKKNTHINTPIAKKFTSWFMS